MPENFYNPHPTDTEIAGLGHPSKRLELPGGESRAGRFPWPYLDRMRPERMLWPNDTYYIRRARRRSEGMVSFEPDPQYVLAYRYKTHLLRTLKAEAGYGGLLLACGAAVTLFVNNWLRKNAQSEENWKKSQFAADRDEARGLAHPWNRYGGLLRTGNH